MDLNISEFLNLYKYIHEETSVSTMHGVKGKEYSRVIVNIDSSEFWNNYNLKFFLLNKDIKETVLDRTHKLFYVACTRAKSSLVINYIIDAREDYDLENIKRNVRCHFGEQIEFIVYE